MNSRYSEEDFLPLSGIQHFSFCERQWALIHLEGEWKENELTIEGKYVHEHVDNPFKSETRKDIRITRSMHVMPAKLGLAGIADVVEYVRENNAPNSETIILEGMFGRWKVRPVEYKRGRSKRDETDAVQLCAQAIALEEVMNVNIKEGYIYYNETRSREEVIFDSNLRDLVVSLADKMHMMLKQGIVPSATKKKHCLRCSLYEVCQPDWETAKGKARKYVNEELNFREEGNP